MTKLYQNLELTNFKDFSGFWNNFVKVYKNVLKSWIERLWHMDLIIFKEILCVMFVLDLRTSLDFNFEKNLNLELISFKGLFFLQSLILCIIFSKIKPWRTELIRFKGQLEALRH